MLPFIAHSAPLAWYVLKLYGTALIGTVAFQLWVAWPGPACMRRETAIGSPCDNCRWGAETATPTVPCGLMVWAPGPAWGGAVTINSYNRRMQRQHPVYYILPMHIANAGANEPSTWHGISLVPTHISAQKFHLLDGPVKALKASFNTSLASVATQVWMVGYRPASKPPA